MNATLLSLAGATTLSVGSLQQVLSLEQDRTRQ